MPDIDDELIARAVRWCAEAGRHASPDELRAALGPLSWDELLAARAVLADPPPARPLGPWALADVARGALPDVAAEREREGQYRRESPAQAGSAATRAGESAAPIARQDAPAGAEPSDRRARRGTARTGGAGRPPAGPVIRRARDRVLAAPVTPAPVPPAVDELYESEGRAVLERLLRVHGARRARIVAALAAGWRRRDAAPVGDDDLTSLLEAHGLTRAFEHRERDELLHALRAAGGVSARAAERVGLPVEAFTRSLARLGATSDAEAIRSVHRNEILRRGTLSERVQLVLEDPDRLADLGVLGTIEDDLRRRLPEQVRALGAGGARSIAAALARSLSAPPREMGALLHRLAVVIEAERPRSNPRLPTAAGRARPGSRPRVDARAPAGPRRGPSSRSAGAPTARTGSRSSPPRKPGRTAVGPGRRTAPASRDGASRPPRGPGRRRPR